MFHRRASQKPSDDLYLSFKARFSHRDHTLQRASSPSSQEPATTLADALPLNLRTTDTPTLDIKDPEPTPRGVNDPWNFGSSGLTPSLMDPTNHGFNVLGNQLQGYYTPTPGGGHTLYHAQAGDLHMGLGTPLSMPTSENALHTGQPTSAFHGFNPHFPQHLQAQHLQNVNPYQMHQQQAYPPQQFSHQPSFDTMDHGASDSPIDDLGMDLSIHQSHSHHTSPDMVFRPAPQTDAFMAPSDNSSGESFRYRVTLNAPTAMIKHPDEIPVTYLNKGQAYTLNVVDTQHRRCPPGTKYRTFVRVSFEDEQQRGKPGPCWQLWKEGRGTNEAHQRNGRLQAVEFVDPFQAGGTEDPSKPKIEVTFASFDGFCVTWSPPAGYSQCAIPVRFNFLSTDFSHSKGVKGIPVRLCAKTETIGATTVSPQFGNGSEVCYCKVKLFRDHGAERKLSNDIAHVKKTIDKMSQQIAQIESGMKDLGKRKRSGSIAKNSMDNRPTKVAKHRRTWSVTSITSNGGKNSAEEDLHIKRNQLNDMFSSSRPMSLLHLRGDEEDDPDLHPVKIPGGAIPLIKQDSGESSIWDPEVGTGPDSAVVSPTPSSNSLVGSRMDSNAQQPTPINATSRVNSNEWQRLSQSATVDVQHTTTETLSAPFDNNPIKVATRSPRSGAIKGSIEALDVDSNYQTPPERTIKPVGCCYVQPSIAGRAPSHDVYRAVYLMSRTAKDFRNALARKCNIEPTQVFRMYRVNRDGLHILFDDDCVRELPEGQDMKAEFCETEADLPSRRQREWNAGPTDVQCDGELSVVEDMSATGYELKLFF